MDKSTGPWTEFQSSSPSAESGPWDDFKAAPEKPRTRGLFEAVNDNVIEFANAAAGGVSALANFVKPGNAVSGFIDENIIKAGEAKQSDVVQGAKRQLSEGLQNAQGIGDEVAEVGSYVLNNPLLAASQAAGSFALPGGAVKGAGAAAKALGAGAKGIETAGRVGGIAAGAAMAGGDAAGTAYDLASKAGATDEQAIAAGRQASVIPALVGGVTGAFGAERLLAGANGFGGNALSRGLKSGLSEAGQEALEEGVTQFEGQRAAMPYDSTIDPTKGVAGAAAMGGIMGFGPGAVLGAMGEGPKPSKQMGIDPNAGPLSRAAASAVDSQPVPQPLGASITGTAPADLMGRATDPLAEQITSGRQKSEDLAVTRNAFADRNSEALAGGGLFGSRADPLANMIADQRSSEASTAANIDRAAQNRAPMTATEAGNMLVAAREQGRDFTVAPHPDGGFVVVPREWVTPQVAAKAEASLMETLGRVAQVEDAPINRAARVSTEPANLNLNTDPVTGYVDNLRSVNTPAARMFVSEFDAGRITRQDVERRMAADRGKTADERIAEAASQAKKPEDPYSLGNIAQSRPEQAPEQLIEIPRTNKLKEARDARRAADELRGTTGASTVTGGDITPPSVESPVADVRSGGRNDDAGTAQPDANGVAGGSVGSTAEGSAALKKADVPETRFGNIESAKAALREARAEVDRVNEIWSRLYRDGVAYIIGDGPSRKVAPNAPQEIKDRFDAYKKAKSAAKRNYDAASAAVDALTPKKERPVEPAKPEPVAQQEPATKPRQLNGSDAQKAKALFTLPAGSTPRPDNWRGNAIKAGKVARSLGLDPKGKRLKEIVAEIDSVDAGIQPATPVADQPQQQSTLSNVVSLADRLRDKVRDAAMEKATRQEIESQLAELSDLGRQNRVTIGDLSRLQEITSNNTNGYNASRDLHQLLKVIRTRAAGNIQTETPANVKNAPQAANDGQAKASPVEARAPEGGNAASDTGVPAAPGSGDVQADGVKEEAKKDAAPAAQTERYEAGKALTKEQRKTVLASLVDVYKQKGADREMKGFDQNGNERFGYVHSPDLFEKSDITGSMVRYYVTLPDGRKAHPTELFPDYTQSDIDAEMQRREQEERNKKSADESRLRVLKSRIADSLGDANRIFNKQNPKRDYIPATLTNGTQFVRTAPETAERDAELLGDGWRVQAPAAQAEKPAENKFAEYDALARQYGYEVRPDGSIGSDGKFPGVTMSVKKGRLRIEGKSGNLLASYAPLPESLGKFLESFWYAEKKKPAAQAEKPSEPVNPEPSKAAQPKAQKPAEDDAFMGVKDDGSKPRKVKLTAEQYEANLSAWANGAPKVLSDKADDYAFKSGQPVLLESFHGTGRGDRVGTKFLKKRATSGPMSFFTSSPELAAGYATGKQDTSLANEDISYADWFKYQPKGQRSPVPLDRAWYFMDEETKRRISERMPDIRTDDDGNIIYEAGGGDIGSYEWNLKQTQRGFDKRGNPLEAAVETWLMSGSLFGEEQDFMKVLKLAGVPVSDITYDNPGETFPFVYKTWVRMNRPLVTSDIPARVEQALKIAAVNDRSRAQASGADMWDKNTRTLREWVKEYFEPSSGDNKYVWTSIPDKVTEVLKAEGFDGIIDWSGKGGGATHPVYIPFEQNQVKSAIGNSGKFDPNKDDILAFGTKESKRQGTPVDRAIMDMAGEGREANEILSFIAKSSKSPYRRQLAQKLLATKSNPAVSIGGDMGSKDGYKNLALYSRKNHEIQLAPEAEYKAEQIFLHEAIHSATLLALDRKTLFGVQMNKLYESVKEQGLSDAYGMKNVGEFVAEAFTNPQFQKALKDYKAPNKEAADMNLWERFVSIVRRILGMEPRQQDALSKALELGAGVMRENMPLRAARSFRAEDGPAYAGIEQTETPEFKRLSALLGPSGVTRLMQSLGNKAIVDGLKRNAKALSDLLESHPGFSEQGRLIDIPPSVVGHVVKVVDDEQIRRAVVIALPVDVVNLLSGKQLSADQVLSDKAMLKNVLSVDGASDVSLAIDKSSAKALLRSVANQATELASLADRSLKSGPARLTNAGDSVFRTHTDSVTETEAFSKWFGDSKVVDSAGKPLVVYHGTNAEFSAFNPETQGGGALGQGFYFAEDRSVAEESGSRLMPVYLSVKNPLILSRLTNDERVDWNSLFDGDPIAAQEKAIADGYDGVLDDVYTDRNWVAFRPEQIKSATGNRGTFDPNDPDIAHFGIADAVEQIKAFDVKEAPKNTWAHYRGMALQALGRRQLVDLYGDEFGTHMHQYDEHVQRMEAEKNETGAEADDLAQRWSKLEERAMVGIGKAALPIGKPKYPGMDRKLAELMHDATLAQMDPDKPMPAGYSKAEYDRLKTRFNTLSPSAKDVYREARDMYVRHYKAVQQAIKDRIERSEMSPSEKKRMMAQLDDKLFKELKGVYFPLARFGQYVIVVKDANGEVKNVTRAETVKEAEQARKELQKAFPAHMGNTVGKVLKQAEFNAGRDAVGKGFMADLMNALDEKGVDDELRDTVAQLYLSSLPDLSWAKHGIHRKGTPGFSQDARRAFAQNAFHGARYLAKLRYSDRLQDELTGMQDYVKAYEGVEEYDSVQAQQVVDEMVKRHEILMNPKSSPVSTALTSFGFLFHMGLSPASAMVNLTQTALVAYPQMGAKWGFGKAGAALTKASEEVVRAKNDLSKSLKGDELAAFERAVKDGTIDVTMAHDLAGIAQGEDQGVMWKVRPVMRWASFMFHHAEKFNRQATFLAAYRLSKQANPEKSEDWHYAEAKKATYDGHYDYSSANRARMMQGNWQRVILLFKAFAQNTIYTLARNAYLSVKALDPKERSQARKTLGGILAAHAAAAGVLGLPIVGPLLTVASWIGGDDDEPWDAEVAMQNAMAEMIGPKAAEVVARGFSRLTPFDLSGRVALNKLILPDVQEGLEGKEWAESAMAAALGPVAGIGVNMARGAQKITEGDYLRGLEDMMPTALRGPLKALRYANEGAVDKTGVVITDEVGAAGVLGQASGFSPSQVRRDTERRSAIYAYDRALLERRSVLMRMMAEARIQGDTETQAEVQKDIQRFNEKNPTRRITPMNIAQSVRNRRKRIDEAEQGVYLPRKRRDALDAVSF